MWFSNPSPLVFENGRLFGSWQTRNACEESASVLLRERRRSAQRGADGKRPYQSDKCVSHDLLVPLRVLQALT